MFSSSQCGTGIAKTSCQNYGCPCPYPGSCQQIAQEMAQQHTPPLSFPWQAPPPQFSFDKNFKLLGWHNMMKLMDRSNDFFVLAMLAASLQPKLYTIENLQNKTYSKATGKPNMKTLPFLSTVVPFLCSHLLVLMICLALGRWVGSTTKRASTKSLTSCGFKFHRFSW